MTAMAYKGSGVAPTNVGGPALFAFGSAAKMAGAGMAEGQQGVDGIRGGALEPFKYVPYAFEAEMPKQPRFIPLPLSHARTRARAYTHSLTHSHTHSRTHSLALTHTFTVTHTGGAGS